MQDFVLLHQSFADNQYDFDYRIFYILQLRMQLSEHFHHLRYMMMQYNLDNGFEEPYLILLVLDSTYCLTLY